jgi:hypothetical protein
MKNALYALIFFCTVSVPICTAQSTLESQIQLTDDALAKYASTHSVPDLRKSLKPLLMIRLPNDKANETYLPRVTGLWIELFKAVDNAYDPTFDPQQRPVLIDAPRNPDRPESAQEVANRELLQKATDYWSLKALDDNATAAFKLFVRYHYREPSERGHLREIFTQQALSPQRIEHILPLQSPVLR